MPEAVPQTLCEPASIGLVVVDDHRLFREAIVSALGADQCIRVLGEGSSATEALSLTQQLGPDLVLLDIDMPGGGLNAASAISDAFLNTKIIMLTFSDNEDHVRRALRLGVHGYVLKGVSGRELCRIVRAVASDEVYIAPTLVQQGYTR